MKPEGVGWIRGAVTRDDNKTIDPTMLCVVATVLLGMPMAFAIMAGITVIDVYVNKQPFSPAGFGGGAAAVIGAIGAFILTAGQLLKQDRAASTATPTQPGVPQ